MRLGDATTGVDVMFQTMECLLFYLLSTALKNHKTRNSAWECLKCQTLELGVNAVSPGSCLVSRCPVNTSAEYLLIGEWSRSGGGALFTLTLLITWRSSGDIRTGRFYLNEQLLKLVTWIRLCRLSTLKRSLRTFIREYFLSLALIDCTGTVVSAVVETVLMLCQWASANIQKHCWNFDFHILNPMNMFAQATFLSLRYFLWDNFDVWVMFCHKSEIFLILWTKARSTQQLWTDGICLILV